MLRIALHLLFATLFAVAPSGAIAQPLLPQCQTSPERVLGYAPIDAQDSFPILVRNTFTVDRSAPEHLGVSVLLPSSLTPDCPGGTIEPMRDIRDLGDGRFTGTVVANSMSFHSHLFGETFTFTADQVWDWQLPALEDGGRLHGAYRLRWVRTYRSVDGGAIMIQLMPDVLPQDWR